MLDRWGIDSEHGVPIIGSIAGDVFSSGRPLVVESVAGDSDHFKEVDIDVHHTTDSMVCVPLTAAGRRLGVMQLLNKRTGIYAERDLALLEHFSAQAAVAIRNVQLFEDLLAHMGLYGSRSPGVGPAELFEELNAPPRHEQVTILFADMRGFTRLSQLVDRPEQTFAYLNEFLRLLATTVLKHEGLVSKFLGDGLMAIFRRPGHSERAVACAFEIVAGFYPLQEAWDDDSNTRLDFLDIGVGIATDSVLLGSVGTERVRDFTAIGGSVVLAAYLTDIAREGEQVIVDRRTFRLAQRLIRQYDGPRTVELRSPGQPTGRHFECYSISSRTSDDAKKTASEHSNVEYRKVGIVQQSLQAFVVMQFGEPYDSLYREVIAPVCVERGFEAVRGDDMTGTGIILQDIIVAIREADVVIAELTPVNANVFYELGHAHATDKPTVLLAERGHKLPFDVSGFRCIFYDDSIAGKREVELELRRHLQAMFWRMSELM